MKLYINEKLISLHNKFYIKDENHNNIYEISNQFLTIGRKTSNKNMSGQELIYIEEELFKLFESHYNVFYNTKFSYKIIKKFNVFKNVYELSNGYTAEGDIFHLCLSIYDNEKRRIACINKHIISIGDKYEIEIFDETKIALILSITAMVANDVDRRQSRN